MVERRTKAGSTETFTPELPRCGAITGWTETELLGRDWVDSCLPAWSRDALRQKFHNLVGGDLSIIQSTILTRSGEERLIEWRAVAR